jgi:hypothetical protein
VNCDTRREKSVPLCTKEKIFSFVELQIALSAFLSFLPGVATETSFPRLKQHASQELVKGTNESSRWLPFPRIYSDLSFSLFLVKKKK